MGTSKDDLIDRIYELEEELKEAKKHTIASLDLELKLMTQLLGIGTGCQQSLAEIML